MKRTELIEAMARAMADAKLWPGAFDSMKVPEPWGGATVERAEWMRQAEAAVADLEQAGLAIVDRDLVERAFRDGLAYASNCVVTDPDEAWRQSKVRAMLASKP